MPKKFRERFYKARARPSRFATWSGSGTRRATTSRRGPARWCGVIERLGDKYQVDELAAKYEFTGHEAMTVPQALAVKEELEKIDELLKQLEEARKTARIGIIDMDLLSEFAEPGDVDQLSALQQQVQDYLRELAEQQGLEQKAGSFRLTPKAYRLFQGKLLERLFQRAGAVAHRPASGAGRRRRGRRAAGHEGVRVRRLDRQHRHPGHVRQRARAQRPGHAGAVQAGRHPDPSHAQHAQVRHLRADGHERLDALRRPVHQRQADGPGARRADPPRVPGRLAAVHRDLLVRQAGRAGADRQPDAQAGDALRPGRAAAGRHEPRRRQRVPASRRTSRTSSTACRWPGGCSRRQDTPNRQIVLITDGLPTAHFEGQMLYLLYPPDPRTEAATMREGLACQREGITINLFLLPSWSQTEEDVRFAFRLAESTTGRVFFTAGRDLDRYVVWDYLSRRRELIH